MDEPIPVISTPYRYKQLDTLRGLAALFVFCDHFMGLSINRVAFNTLRPTPASILFNGNASVIFFFVLSGFVLSLPFIDGTKPLKFTAFYIKRIFRIYPAFIFAIVLSLLLKHFLFDKTGMVPFSAWMQSFWTWDWSETILKETLRTFLLVGPNFDSRLIDPPVWSLIIEMKMSLVLPFLILIVSRNNVWMNVLLLFILAALTYQHDSWALSIFYWGVLMARYKDDLIQHVKLWPSVAVIAILLVAVILYNNNLEFLGLYERMLLPFKNIFSNYVTAIGGCIVMIIVLARKRVTHFFEHRILIFLGDISYGIYLIHMPMLFTVASLFSSRFALSQVYIFLISLAVTVIIAYLLLVLIERPFQKIAVRLIKRYPVLNSINI